MFICSYHIYKLSFLNFLLGKQPNGPGQFMFGTVNWDNVTSWLDISLISPPPADTALVDTKNNKKLPRQENNPNTVNYDYNKRKSDKRSKAVEPKSIVDVIDKNGSRRKSIIV